MRLAKGTVVYRCVRELRWDDAASKAVVEQLRATMGKPILSSGKAVRKAFIVTGANPLVWKGEKWFVWLSWSTRFAVREKDWMDV